MSAFAGQAAVVTGASSGIGEAISMALAREGARLLLSGRSTEKLDQVADQARAFSPAVETWCGRRDSTPARIPTRWGGR